MQPTAVFLPGKSMDRGTWWAAVHGVKNHTQLSMLVLQLLITHFPQHLCSSKLVLGTKVNN